MSKDIVQYLDEWVVKLQWDDGVENGGPTRLTIEPFHETDPPVGGISSTLLRQINFQLASEELRTDYVKPRRGKALENYEKRRSQRLRTALDAGANGDEYLALLSSAYVSTVNRGQPKPNEYLAELVGKKPSTIRGHLWQARKRGFLDGNAGRAAGRLTPKSEVILDQIAPQELRG